MKSRGRKLRILAGVATLVYAGSWADFALAGPSSVPVDGVSPGAVPAGFRGAAHEGVDIFAPKGTPVRAAVGGVVVGREAQPRGGNVVFVLGRDAVLYFYAHLEAPSVVTVGAVVETGTLLGRVGDTGNAKGRAPHLHFEARVVATGFAPVDPKVLLGPDPPGPGRRIRAAMREIGDPR